MADKTAPKPAPKTAPKPAPKTAPKPAPKPSKEEAAASTKQDTPGNTMQGCGDVVVVIDPGHGDRYIDEGQPIPKPDTGAVDPKKEPYVAVEKDIALEVSKAIKSNLTGKPHVKAVILTREADVTTVMERWEWRIKVARANDARVFVSVHVNSTPTASGYEIYYHSDVVQPFSTQSEKLATAIHKAYKALKPHGAPVRAESKRMGIIRYRSDTKIKAASLVETGFIQKDKDILKSSAAAIGKDVAEGIANYINDNINALCP